MRILIAWNLIAASLLLQACAPSQPLRPAQSVPPAAPPATEPGAASPGQPPPSSPPAAQAAAPGAAPAPSAPATPTTPAASAAPARPARGAPESNARAVPRAPPAAPAERTRAPPQAPPQVASQTPSPPGGAAAAPAGVQAPPALDLSALEHRLRDTSALGIFTKLTLKNQVDDLLKRFGVYHSGHGGVKLEQLRQSYDSLLAKVVGLLQGKDASLAQAIATSREALWRILVDPAKFAAIRN